ncbi:TetR/AcrR family transcriptional regulator [Rhodococcus sp. NPDC058514]|uniref:TetR/AcrR family transcriptional regulator n=1 Tax=Rhodococcus sp. NPDC058514 TaxID=3346532 RepID=UPI0036467673
MSTERRSWAGTDLEQRQRARPEKLLAAGVDLLGAADGPAVSVRAVCRAAGVTERYFYESFGDREEFVRAVYADVGERAHLTLVGAVESAATPRDRATAGVLAFVELMVDHPEMGRVLMLAPITEPALGGRGLALAPTFVVLVQDQLDAVRDPAQRQLVAVGLVGALTSLFIGYLDGTIAPDRERFVAHCVDLLIGANRPVRRA